jgi:GNAT superfamily N-acetyltransferase
MSFGIEQIHALLDLYRDAPPLPELPKGVEIRKAEKADRQHLADMSDVIWRQQVQAPTWAVMMPEAVAENVAGWAELVDEADVIVWLAFKDGQLAGTQGYWPFEQADDNLHIPENAQHMSVAGTKESARGQGISTLLTKYGLAQAKAAGAPFIETDWRSANLLASRFWPKQGFKPVVYRLVRRIDSRIAWAKGEVE